MTYLFVSRFWRTGINLFLFASISSTLFAEGSSPQVLWEKTFSMKADSAYFEFRKGFTQEDVEDTQDVPAESEALWFVSFAERKIPRSYSLEGNFRHENYSGHSYILELSPQSKKILDSTLGGNVAGIWDFIECDTATLQVVNHNGKLKLRAEALKKCRFIWDD